MGNELELTDNEKKVIKDNFFPQNASVEDMRFCMSIANQFGLNPLLNQIYFVGRKSKVGNNWIEKVSPMVGRDGFLTLAHKSGKFAGIETTTTIKKTPRYDGKTWTEERDLVAICKVYRTDSERPFVVEVAFNEYAGKTREGDLTKFWKEKGVTMLMKVAESQCLRKAFNVSGIYAEEELADVNPMIKAPLDKEGEKPKSLNDMGLDTPAHNSQTGEITEAPKEIEVEVS